MKSSAFRTFAALGVVAVAVVVIVGVVLASGNDGAAEPVAIGGNVPADEQSERQPAPPIEGPDPVTGEPVNVADFSGKPVVLSFWASWCAPCRAELPALQELADQHPEAQVVGVNLQDSPSDARSLQEELGFTFPSVSDDGALAAQFGLLGMPTTFFLDDQHRVVGLVTGGTDLEGFEAGLELAQS